MAGYRLSIKIPNGGSDEKAPLSSILGFPKCWNPRELEREREKGGSGRAIGESEVKWSVAMVR